MYMPNCQYNTVESKTQFNLTRRSQMLFLSQPLLLADANFCKIFPKMN